MDLDHDLDIDLDLMGLEKKLSKKQLATMSNARAVVQEKLQPLIHSAFENEKLPEVIPSILGSAGLLGGDLGGYGLPGLDAFEYGLVMREIERCDSGFRSFVSVQSSLATYAIHQFGSEAQKSEYLPHLATGKIVGAFSLTEPQGGSDPASMLTEASYENGRWILTGKKRWVTNAMLSDLIVVWAKTEKGIRGFVVPSKSKGVNIKPIKSKLSMRASQSCEIDFEQVELKENAILPLSKGLGSALKCLNQARYGIIWGVLGAAEACLDETIRYVKRVLFKRPLSSFQLVQAKLSDAYRDLTLAQLYAFELATLKQSGSVTPAQISLGKANNVEVALRIARNCRDILGGNGILMDFQTMRHMVNLETVSTYEGTHDVHRLIVGQYLTGDNAFL